ncbi:DNA primase, phage/plasmid domain protein [mine drainage metagenome]|uniref:DNA primase, phage/plasmid domain protein n=1 Tax=mine drainage metagenome TaxID=410659 RepID=T1CR73_9ZZZZ
MAYRDSGEMRLYDPSAGYYIADAESYLKQWIRERYVACGSYVGTEMAATRRTIDEIIAGVRDRSYVTRSDVDPPGRLVLQNGTFDPVTHALDLHAPSPRYTRGLPVRWDPTATAPRYEAFLQRALPDPAVREAAEEAAGYCLWGTQPLRTAVFLYGPTSTGKSTYLAILRGVLGVANTSSIDLAELTENRFKAAEVANKLANIRSDLPAKLIQNVGLLKELTGGVDRISAEKKHQHPFEFEPHAKLFFSANRLPHIPDVTPAFWIRWILLPFETQIAKADQEQDYSATLLELERDGIFRLMIEASDRLRARGRFPDLPTEVASRWLRNSDPALYVAVYEITDAQDGSVSLDEYAERVNALCDQEGIVGAPDRRELGAAMVRAHPRAHASRLGRHDDRATVYLGVRWIRPLVTAGPSTPRRPVVSPILLVDPPLTPKGPRVLIADARGREDKKELYGLPVAPGGVSPRETS